MLDHPLIRDMTFERFDVRSLHLPIDERKRMENAYRQALAFAEKPDGWLLFMGPHGAGKTHLAAAIANYRRARGETPAFVVVPDLLDYLRRGFAADDGRDAHAAFDEMKHAPLLILDDLDTQTGIAWVRDRLFQLLNFRHTARLPDRDHDGALARRAGRAARVAPGRSGRVHVDRARRAAASRNAGAART